MPLLVIVLTTLPDLGYFQFCNYIDPYKFCRKICNREEHASADPEKEPITSKPSVKESRESKLVFNTKAICIAFAWGWLFGFIFFCTYGTSNFSTWSTELSTKYLPNAHSRNLYAHHIQDFKWRGTRYAQVYEKCTSCL